ncbi:hypothetical protein GWD52_12320 [Enterobacteriaceae bacterium 4M9]|nr:hypothetical protein [Enterobacteriaceae bacterium 4M9]
MVSTEHTRLMQPGARAALVASLESWRYFALMLCPPLYWALVNAQGMVHIVVLAMIALASVLVWRLWLDARLFRQINWSDAEAGQTLGEALAIIWQRPALRTMAFEARWRGASRLLHQAGYATVMVWIVWLGAMLWVWWGIFP